MTPSGRESDCDVSSYLDGVPVKISERYRPPMKVVLPVGFQHRLDSTIQNTLRDSSFDFTFCREVVKNSETLKQKKAEIRDSRKARIAAKEEQRRAERDRELAEQIEKFTLKAETLAAASVAAAAATTIEETASSLPSPPLSPPAVAPQNDFSSILTPLPMPAPTKANSPTVPATNTFNISDFEADTSSPFDNMELKTINEMEELAHVLQPNVTSEATLPKENYQYSQHYYSQSNFSKSNNVPEVATSSKNADVYGAYGNVPSSSQSNGPTFSLNNQQQNYNFPVNHSSYFYPTMQHQQQQQQQQQQSWMYPGQNSAVYPSYVQSNYVSTQNAYPPGAHNYSQTGYNTLTHSTPAPDLSLKSRTSKSVPDIMEELQREILPNRSTAVSVPKPLPLDHLPPPRPASIGSTGLENWKPWPELDSPVSLESHEPPVAPPRIIRAPPDPLSKLPDGTKLLARQLSEMGFPLDRVARACETVGHDQKKVLDYLLQVQAIEEQGFPGSRVELAIGKLGLDESKALKFLPALGQLIDLGFAEEKASEALIKADCDRDKALDALLS